MLARPGAVRPPRGGEHPHAKQRQRGERSDQRRGETFERALRQRQAQREEHAEHARHRRPRIGIEPARLQTQRGDRGSGQQRDHVVERRPEPAHAR